MPDFHSKVIPLIRPSLDERALKQMLHDASAIDASVCGGLELLGQFNGVGAGHLVYGFMLVVLWDDILMLLPWEGVSFLSHLSKKNNNLCVAIATASLGTWRDIVTRDGPIELLRITNQIHQYLKRDHRSYFADYTEHFIDGDIYTLCRR